MNDTLRIMLITRSSVVIPGKPDKNFKYAQYIYEENHDDSALDVETDEEDNKTLVDHINTINESANTNTESEPVNDSFDIMKSSDNENSSNAYRNRKLPSIKLPIYDPSDPIGSLEELTLITDSLNLPAKDSILHYMSSNLKLLSQATKTQKENIDEFRQFLLNSLGLLNPQNLLSTLGNIKQSGQGPMEYISKIEALYRAFLN